MLKNIFSDSAIGKGKRYKKMDHFSICVCHPCGMLKGVLPDVYEREMHIYRRTYIYINLVSHKREQNATLPYLLFSYTRAPILSYCPNNPCNVPSLLFCMCINTCNNNGTNELELWACMLLKFDQLPKSFSWEDTWSGTKINLPVWC